MTIAQLIGIAINLSMFLIVLALGLKASERDSMALFRDPSLLARSLLSMNLLMVVAALLIIFVLKPAPEIGIALVALALSPVPPILPGKQLKAGGSSAYSIGLLVAASIASLVIVPLGLLALDAIFALDMHISLGALIRVVLISILLPLAIGIGAHAWRPQWAIRAAAPVQVVAWIMLIIGLIPVLLTSWSALLLLLGNGLVIALVAFTLIGLAAGHWLGGPDADNRTVLALATSARHPGVAMAIASVNFPDAKLAGVVVLYHLLISTIVVLPYVKWRTGLHAGAQRRAV